MSTPPPCPITGEPAVRLVQVISARLLTDLWRYMFGADVRTSFKGVRRFELWESPTGLYFFEPRLEGDDTFYKGFYRFGAMRRYLHDSDRSEFHLAARCVNDGDRVLDVGCGFGPFRHVVPQARYLGLDPHFVGRAEDTWAKAESLADHALSHAGTYDVVTSFQVVEHVADPAAFVTDMARVVRPGGKVIVGVPHIAGGHSRVPNSMINAVPHHLTWWTEEALTAVAARAGLVNPRVETAHWCKGDVFIYWMARLSLVKCRDRYYRHAWAWHASNLLAATGAFMASRVLPVPKPGTDAGISLLLVAERPAG